VCCPVNIRWGESDDSGPIQAAAPGPLSLAPDWREDVLETLEAEPFLPFELIEWLALSDIVMRRLVGSKKDPAIDREAYYSAIKRSNGVLWSVGPVRDSYKKRCCPSCRSPASIAKGDTSSWCCYKVTGIFRALIRTHARGLLLQESSYVVGSWIRCGQGHRQPF